jgi:pyruvate,water dikinase
VALLAREIEGRYYGIPQDIEWTYDGEQLWLLQARPITNLQPIWTRKIAAEVIPGTIRPLTWSINRPLTCGVWGEIFTLVLGKRATDLDFNETATLHFQHAYFNATLLGKIFRRMGLPPESLEFLTRGAKFSKPPLIATLGNFPGLLRLWQQERNLLRDFARDERRYFAPLLQQLAGESAIRLAPEALLERIEGILGILKRATYYSILVPLSFAFRQALAKVPAESLDNSQTPEVASLRDLEELAGEIRLLLSPEQLASINRESLFTNLGESSAGKVILTQFQQWLDRYGYLGQVGTDIAVPRWREDSQPVEELLVQFILSDRQSYNLGERPTKSKPKKAKSGKLQERLHLKGRVTEVYSQLLAHLRWSFVALENIWLEAGILQQPGDIFFLEFSEVERLVWPQKGCSPEAALGQPIPQLLQQRRQEFAENCARQHVPYITYGNPEPFATMPLPLLSGRQQLQGIAASPGRVEGRVRIMKTLQGVADMDSHTILVVPYTDSGWAPLLARVGGLIAEVGGSLSHGAIVAREYGIPAVMDVHHATQLLRDNQRVLIDGRLGIVEVLE